MTWIDLVSFVLAVGAVEDVWFNGEIFAGCRSRVENWDNWLGELIMCPFCLSYHIPYILIAMFYVPLFYLEDPWILAAKLPIFALAITRAANLVNGLVPTRMRYDAVFYSLGAPEEPEDNDTEDFPT